jgi:ectoine hydroxylase-related dioxygenase (phytanoyl-CoA dioxygenase family)
MLPTASYRGRDEVDAQPPRVRRSEMYNHPSNIRIDTLAETSRMTTDLAERSEPLGGFFERPVGRDDLERYRLSDEQIAFFHENGYLAGVRILDDKQIAQLRGELADFVDSDCTGRDLFYEYNSNESTDPSKVLFHALGAWRVSPGFHDVLWHPAFVVPASQLLGGAVRFWHDQLFVKPAKHGGVVAWHQDYSYWTRTQPMAHLTCWIGLDDATKDNGCVYYVPGSHRWELLPITGLAGDMDAVRSVLSPDRQAMFDRQVPVELKAGEATFHHPLTLHGSYENRTDGPRRATVVNVFRDGVKSASDQSLLEGVPPIPNGRTMGGKFFPLLYAP